MAPMTILLALAPLALALFVSGDAGDRRSGSTLFRDQPGLDLSSVMRAGRYPAVGSKVQIAKARKHYRSVNNVYRRLARKYRNLSKRAARPRAKPSVKSAAQKAKAALLIAGTRRSAALKRLNALRFRPGRGKVIISGQRLPTTCFCKRAPAGESKCYFYTRGRLCKVRYCAAKFECVGKKQARGALCSLRKVNTRVVPTRRGRCTTKYIQSYMYVPYYM